MDEVRDGFRQAAADYAGLAHETAPSQQAGEARAAVLAPGAGQVIVVWFPASAPPHLLADVARFIDAQREAQGITVPVLVMPAETVTAETILRA
jgi:hypothetical protein